MTYTIDPLTDPRWLSYLRTNDNASVFHTPQWLRAIQTTYAHDPFILTNSAPEENLRGGLVFCTVKSWLTGSRLISLPFSDHCQPLIADHDDLDVLLQDLSDEVSKGHWKYLEIRPLYRPQFELAGRFGFARSQSFWSHILDLRSDLDDLFRGFHKSSVQRKIRRAEREGLLYEEGRSEELLRNFYSLLLRTRRRHQLPPPPIVWFRNLLDCMGDMMKIRLASKDERPVASIITLVYKNTMVYKYGCSDARLHNLGGIHFLLWKAIQEAKSRGLDQYDLGRTDLDNNGLITFKENWGARRSTLNYFRYPAQTPKTETTDWKMRVAKSIFSRIPDSLLVVAGRLLYKHIA